MKAHETVAAQRMPVRWEAAMRPKAEGEVCGDAHLVRPVAQGYLVAVADGLGHGVDASVAAERAVATADAITDLSPARVLERCHEACRNTRGVVMTVALVDTVSGSLRWAGVGNVEALMLHRTTDGVRRETLMLPGGVLGYALPRLREQSLDLEPRDRIVMVTDGVSPSFVSETSWLASHATTAADVLERYGTVDDDALVLLGRCGEAA
jgi:negative regulator of sigma-B (phosphoserine phosphatase)